jgi:hypothetical protein
MASLAFLPDEPALCANSVGDDAGEDEDHPRQGDEVGEVLLERERPDELVVDRVEDRVGDEVQPEPDDDHDGASLGQAWDRQAARRGFEELGPGPGHVHVHLRVSITNCR